MILVTHDPTTRERAKPVIEALLSDPFGPAEIILVDNSASEEGRLFATSQGLALVSRKGGFADGCNEGVLATTQPVVVLLGHDTIPNRGWLPPLISALEEPGVGAAIPTIEDGSHPGTFNTSGGHLTYLGLAWVSDFGVPIPDDDVPTTVDFPCGGAMAMKRETWDRFEGFRPGYFIYQEDTDLGWRLRLAGLNSVRIPRSRVVHDYEFGRQPNKMFLLERNRLINVLSNYRLPTLVVLFPVLLFTEVAIAVVALRDGWAREKLKSWVSVWVNRSWIREGRSLTERNRLVGDAEMLRSMRHEISTIPAIATPRGAVVVDRLLGVYKAVTLAIVTLIERL